MDVDGSSQKNYEEGLYLRMDIEKGVTDTWMVYLYGT